MNEKNLKFKCLQPGGGVYFDTLKKLAHEVGRRKSNFESVGIKLIQCLIAVQNFKRFARV